VEALPWLFLLEDEVGLLAPDASILEELLFREPRTPHLGHPLLDVASFVWRELSQS